MPLQIAPQRLPLPRAEAAPDPERLVSDDRIGQAVSLDRAVFTDLLCRSGGRVGGRKEKVRVGGGALALCCPRADWVSSRFSQQLRRQQYEPGG